MKRTTLFLLWLGCIFIACVALVWQLLAIIFKPDRSLGIAREFDVTLAAAWSGRTNNTISLIAAQYARAGSIWARLVCRILDSIVPGHCENQIKGSK
jgi:hypothetical protein